MLSKFPFVAALTISVIIHGLLFSITTGWRGPQPSKTIKLAPTQVTWVQTVARKKPTPKHKLPPPEVPRAKPKPKIEKVVHLDKKKKPTKKKSKVPKKPKKKPDRKKLLAEALKHIEQQVDNRPTPKDNNFATGQEKAQTLLLAAQLDALKTSPLMDTYMQQLKSMIIDHFHWYQSDSALKAKIEIKLGPAGQLQETAITASSGNASFDRATLRAVEKSSPFPPPPATLMPLFKQENIELSFHGSHL